MHFVLNFVLYRHCIHITFFVKNENLFKKFLKKLIFFTCANIDFSTVYIVAILLSNFEGYELL